jgi:Proteobacterial transcriptional regulator-like domain
MPPVLDWRSPAAYAYLDELNPAGLAWEFLRRNPDYQRDYQAAAGASADQAEFPEAVILRWGLRFPGRSGSASG